MHVAVAHRVNRSTHRHALSALLVLRGEALGVQLTWNPMADDGLQRGG